VGCGHDDYFHLSIRNADGLVASLSVVADPDHHSGWLMITDSKVEEAIGVIAKNADLIGQLRGNKAFLEHRIKIERGQRFLDASGTVAERESIAWTDTAVYALCTEYRDTVTELETILTKFKAAELTTEVWRTQAANSRRGNI
jgi:hypothetical protein